ncbi:MAG: HAD family hydrolase, partial [Deltaproteobacteria bacterium]|nr:HAD family hydrolase [Deltaproteobacteria bacterium]
LYSGDVGSGNIIKQIFQEIYLGKDLFESTYGIPTKVYHEDGYINREKLLIDKSLLESLSKKNILAVATGRPKVETYYSLDLFDLKRFFAVIYTLDDCVKEEQKLYEQEKREVSLSKPDPYMLDAIRASLKDRVSESFYIGDMPDDMISASRSKGGYTGIGILLSSPDKDNLKEEMIRAGADYIIEDFKELKKIVQLNIAL